MNRQHGGDNDHHGNRIRNIGQRVAITFYLSSGRTHGNTRGYLQEVLGQSGFSRDRPSVEISAKRSNCIRKNRFFPMARRSNPMKPPARIKPEAQIKKHARPEKIQEKGPLRPFFLSTCQRNFPTSKRLSNMKRIVPTSNALFQHVKATCPCK
jgi:hypothetical protein